MTIFISIVFLNNFQHVSVHLRKRNNHVESLNNQLHPSTWLNAKNV